MTPIVLFLAITIMLMMGYIRKFKKGNQTYYGEVKGVRVGNKVKQIYMGYIGTSPDAPKRRFELEALQLKSIAKALAEGTLTPDDVFNILEKKGEPVTRFDLEKMGIQYHFVKKTLFITLYPLKPKKGRSTAKSAEKNSPSGKHTRGRK